MPGALGGRVNVLHERSRVTIRRGPKRSFQRVCRTPPRAAEQRLTSCTHHARTIGIYTHTTHIYLCLCIHTPRPLNPPRRHKLITIPVYTTLRVFHSRISFQEFAPHAYVYYYRVMNNIRGRPDAKVLLRRGLCSTDNNRRANRVFEHNNNIIIVDLYSAHGLRNGLGVILLSLFLIYRQS